VDDYDATPVDGDPFAEPAPTPDSSGWTATPVDHDPFQPSAHPGFAASADPQTPSSAGGPPLDPADRDAMIKTIAGEAGSEPPLGQAAVAHVILNRVAAGGYGDGVQGVVQAPVKPGSVYHQFSAWNPPGVAESSKTAHTFNSDSPQYASIGSIVDKAYSGLIPDPTGGATHYYAPKAMPGRRPPAWAAPLARENDVTIGNQRFVGLSTGPGQSLPSQIAGGEGDEGISGS
jgi:hypothetical protein